eukprot:c20780_g1_i1 orf=639-4133(+)
MPLTRYEIRNEYSLANPDLYRAAAKDDPEGLLEGVAMAGLVGIVRQLGDLAEFAAEVFHDLHEEVLATAARGHELLIRVQQLEAELPLVEKMMVAESSYVNFSYNPGVEWHANIQNDQNHFTQGDLPRFIRNAYEDCRGPPRLFLLDKFDVAGAGACLKRYTDPSFFRMEWASSELMKAEKEQQDKKARRIKKKGRRQRNGEIREAFLVAHMQPRMRHAPLDVENVASTSVHSHISNTRHSSEQEGSKSQVHEHKQVSPRLLIPDQEGPNLKASMNVPPQDLKLNEAFVDSSDLGPSQEHNAQEHKVNDACMVMSDPKHDPSEFDSEKTEAAGYDAVVTQTTELPMDTKTSEDVADEFASETDNYMDALTTMDSEVETDSEVKMFVKMDGESGPSDGEEEATVHSRQVTSDHLENSGETDFVTEDGVISGVNTLEKSDISEIIEPACVVGSPQTEERKSAFVDTEKSESTFVDDSYVSPSIQKSSAPAPISGSATSTPALEKPVVKSEEFLESESVEGVPETPETPDANEYDSIQLEGLTSAFHQLPEPAVPLGNGSQGNFPERLGSLSSHLGVKTSVHLSREFSESCMEKNSFEDSESEPSEGIKESSPHSSANSSIQPMTWATDFSRRSNNMLDSDDELDGMQVSSSSPSSSSSALSSPRPSTLATTVFSMDFDNKRQSPLSSQGSIKSSSESLLGISPHSVGSTSPLSPVSPMEKDADPSMRSPHRVQTASLGTPSRQKTAPDSLPGFKSSLQNFSHEDLAVPAENHSVLADESENFPPPPPLPPLEWRMMRRFSGMMSSSTKASESSVRPLIPQSLLSRPRESSNIPKPFTFSSLVSQNIPTMHDELEQAHKPSTTWHGDSQDLSVHHGELQELSIKADPIPRTLPVIPPMSSKAFEPFSAELSTPSSFPERLGQLVQPYEVSTSHELPESSMPEAFTTASESFPVQTDDLLHSFRSSTTESADDDQGKFTASLAQTGDHDLEGLSAPTTIKRGSPVAAVPNKVFTDSSDDDYVKLSFSPLMDKKIPAPPRPEESLKDSRPPLPSSGLEFERGSRPISASKIEGKDSLIAAIASHDKSTLKKVPVWSQSSRTPHSDDREVLLEQIRTGSFSLRHTKIEKQEAPRRVTSINVAAILEKANAIRQAFAGSDDDDEDDDWSDA